MADDAFTLSELEQLACVVYDDTKLLNDLKRIIKTHQVEIDEGQLFDHLIGVFEELGKFPFIPSSSMDDIAKEYIDDTGNLYDLVHSSHLRTFEGRPARDRPIKYKILVGYTLSTPLLLLWHVCSHREYLTQVLGRMSPRHCPLSN